MQTSSKTYLKAPFFCHPTKNMTAGAGGTIQTRRVKINPRKDTGEISKEPESRSATETRRQP